MNEYISREAAVAKITFLCELREIVCDPDDEFLRGLKNALNTIKSNELIPSVDVPSVKHGKWENEHLEDDIWWADCTNCKNETHSRFGRVSSYAFCPNCGAKMDGDAE